MSKKELEWFQCDKDGQRGWIKDVRREDGRVIAVLKCPVCHNKWEAEQEKADPEKEGLKSVQARRGVIA